MADARFHRRADAAHSRRHPTIIRANNRFRILLVFLVLALLVTPLFQSETYALEAFRIIFSIALMGSVYAIGRKWNDIVIGAIIASPSVIGRWLPGFSTSVPVFVVVTGTTALFLAFVAYKIIAEVARLRTVTVDTIFGAGCGYLLLGGVWAFAYSIINVLMHGAFIFTNVGSLPPGADLMQRSRLVALFYFSFITLTSTGFGDILPMAPAAKALAVCEVIVGQFYVATLVARLVSLEIISSTAASNKPED
jgi:hypothetical protein